MNSELKEKIIDTLYKTGCFSASTQEDYDAVEAIADDIIQLTNPEKGTV